MTVHGANAGMRLRQVGVRVGCMGFVPLWSLWALLTITSKAAVSSLPAIIDYGVPGPGSALVDVCRPLLQAL